MVLALEVVLESQVKISTIRDKSALLESNEKKRKKLRKKDPSLPHGRNERSQTTESEARARRPWRIIGIEEAAA